VLEPLIQRAKLANERFNPLAGRRWGRYTDAGQLVHDHFAKRSELSHINYASIRDLVLRMGGRPQTIMETGMSAWGTDSTRLFDAYVRSFGGALWSVDLSPVPVERLRGQVGPTTTLACEDSVSFLERWVAEHPGVQLDVVYLDSWDVDFADPLPAGEHCLRELKAIEPALGRGTLMLVDDTPGSLEDVPEGVRDDAIRAHAKHGVWPGKGMLLDSYLAHTSAEKLRHGYQVLYRF
jgi:hypothetical protein